MRSSAGTNFELPGSVVARTKSTIACFAGPSFQEASDALNVVWAWTGEESSAVDRAGSKTSFEITARRSNPGGKSSDVIALLLKTGVATVRGRDGRNGVILPPRLRA